MKKPDWITSIPSLNKEDPVKDCACRIADSMKIPYLPCLEKIENNSKQKTMANSIQQQNNIISAFRVNENIEDGNCILFDDIVDSGWTFAVVSALLLSEGASTVTPIALANSSRGDE